ncbi:response regulator transcription factor [Leisingera sp. MMG026]|uniref:response regulator transcription factor n=1 Tax=Leisingera sp. MMG026 TaxID=2909982 RepID=UPI001F1FB3AD|nr:response regulator transcription factor [Leisingera sp. MMG026]MCF6433517.1 response regulator transcription factor [Leisingera sp. MMG026]
MSASILIVDDDVEIVSELDKALTTAGYSTRHTTNVPEARRAWSDAPTDLCLVDIVMPGLSGRVFCSEISERSDAGVIMMSSLSDEETIIALLDLGADDYLIKPFSTSELLARIRAVMRRKGKQTNRVASRDVQIGEWAFDPQLRRLSRTDGVAVPLTQSEASVLWFLSRSPGIVFSREDLLAVASRRQHSGKDDRAVDALIKRLRRKLEPDPTHPTHILTEWGKGYAFRL